MSNKKHLSKLALTLALTTAASITGQAEAAQTTNEVFFAQGSCAGHGCADNKPTTTTNQQSYNTPSQRNDYQQNTSTNNTWSDDQNRQGYGEPVSYNDLAKTPRTAQMNAGAEYDKYESARLENARFNDYNRYDYNGNYNTNAYPNRMNTADYRDVNQANYNNAAYRNDAAYNTNAALYSSTEYVAPATAQTTTTTTSTTTLTESQLLTMLNPQTREVYRHMDSRGKALALQLASQNTYADKNQAVLEAGHRLQTQQSTIR